MLHFIPKFIAENIQKIDFLDPDAFNHINLRGKIFIKSF